MSPRLAVGSAEINSSIRVPVQNRPATCLVAFHSREEQPWGLAQAAPQGQDGLPVRDETQVLDETQVRAGSRAALPGLPGEPEGLPGEFQSAKGPRGLSFRPVGWRRGVRPCCRIRSRCILRSRIRPAPLCSVGWHWPARCAALLQAAYELEQSMASLPPALPVCRGWR